MRTWIGRAELDGIRSTSIWRRFNSKKTIATGGTKLFRTAILENVVNFTVPAPCTDRDVLEQIAGQSKPPIPIESLPDVLNKTVHPRGQTLFGFCGNRIDQIARNYPAMQWWISKNGLHMEAIVDSNLSEFDALAGKLMSEARPRRGKNKRLAIAEYDKIVRELDRVGFKPVDHLEGKHRERLADWNKKNPRKAIKTFSAALSSKMPELTLRRGVKRRLSRAESAWQRQSGLSAP